MENGDKVYIAGKITNYPKYKEHFSRAEAKLIEHGCLCMNPSILPEGFPYDTYLPICYAMIDACDIVYLLNNWKDSKGAILEFKYASSKGKQIVVEEED